MINKRAGIASGVMLLFWVSVAVLVILVSFVLISIVVKSYIGDQSSDVVVQSVKMDNYVSEFERNFKLSSEVGLIKKEKDGIVILEDYFPSFNVVKDESGKKDVMFIKKNCLDNRDEFLFQGNFDYVFINGIFDLVEDVSEDELDLVYSLNALKGCENVFDYFIEEGLVEFGDYSFDYSIIDKMKGDVCCYVKKK